ncbi:unnamed protein product [Ambrosiozyma monospora]|uniref:Unnamed protein product n=1 Tax=Ambrosiozyma monospora TaxID=43982 RepID=A0ACB5SVI1_AMBMO|nr:unnamed protein product [Ambrosiozyma monospora]
MDQGRNRENMVNSSYCHISIWVEILLCQITNRLSSLELLRLNQNQPIPKTQTQTPCLILLIQGCSPQKKKTKVIDSHSPILIDDASMNDSTADGSGFIDLTTAPSPSNVNRSYQAITSTPPPISVTPTSPSDFTSLNFRSSVTPAPASVFNSSFFVTPSTLSTSTPVSFAVPVTPAFASASSSTSTYASSTAATSDSPAPSSGKKLNFYLPLDEEKSMSQQGYVINFLLTLHVFHDKNNRSWVTRVQNSTAQAYNEAYHPSGAQMSGRWVRDHMITWLEEGKKLYNTSQNKVERDKSGDNSKFQLTLLQQAVLKLYVYKVSHDKYEQALKLYKNATTIGYVGRTYSKSAVIDANETINLESEKAQVETCLFSEKKKD